MACDLGLARWIFSHLGLLGLREKWSHGAEHAERAEAALQTDLAKVLPRTLTAQAGELSSLYRLGLVF